jgi:hypothetical protein
MADPALTDVDDATFDENTVNATPQIIDAAVTFTDADDDFDGGTLKVSGLLAEDIVSVNNQGSGAGQIGFNSGTGEVSYGGVVIGIAVGGVGGTLTITFDADATAEAIDALLQNLTYANTSDTPTANRTLTINVTDAAGNDLGGPLTFSQQSGAANPFNGFDPGQGSAPAFGDIDGDGDLDMVLGGSTGGTPFFLKYFENTGSAAAPTLVERTGGANPFGALGVGFYSMPALVDLDNDDDLDLVVGNQLGTFRYFRNTGDETTPTYVELTAGANPFNTFDVGLQSSPTLADLDGDGDLDLLAGAFDGQFFYYRNTGTAAAPAFTAQVGVANPLNGVDVGANASPTLGDVDGDGDFDLVVGAQSGLFFYFENTGTTVAPTFVARTGGDNPLNGTDIGGLSAPRLVDLDGDGDLDLAVGEYDGVVNYFSNTTLHGATLTITVNAQAEPIAGTGAGEVLSGTSDGELIEGLGGNDVLKGNDGDDVLDGGDDNDTLVGGMGADDLIGGAGNDDLNGGPGADDMAGGAGDDYYTTDGADTLAENAAEGTDTVRSSVTFTLGANFENLLLSGSGNLDGTGNGENNTLTGNIGNNVLTGLGGMDTLNGMAGADTLYGGDNNDTLNGGNDDDQLFGEAGTDTLNGGSGHDLLNGGTGADTMAGGTGDDTYVVDDAGDIVTELANQGTDTVQTTRTSYSLGANVENLTGTLGAKQTLNGNDLRNIIVAGAGDDIIDARGDNDRITGGGGNDRMTGGLGADVFILLDSDMINSTVGGTRQADVILDLNFGQGDRVDLSAIDADIITGGDQAFTFVTSFSGVAGEARLVYIASSNSSALQLDVDGDGAADYQLNIKGGDFTTGPVLTGSEPVNQGGWVL